jgi:hypothetical protein
VRDLGLPLIAVIQVDPTPANGPDANADTDHNHSTQGDKRMNANRQTTVIKRITRTAT